MKKVVEIYTVILSVSLLLALSLIFPRPTYAACYGINTIACANVGAGSLLNCGSQCCQSAQDSPSCPGYVAPVPPGGGSGSGPGSGGGGTGGSTTGGASGSNNVTCSSATSVNTAIGCIEFGDINTFMGDILKWALGVGAGVAFLMIIYSGFLIMTASGDPKRIQAGQELLTSAIGGLILLVLSMFILNVIGINILGLDKFGL